jgi:hypothetical protein
VEDEKNVEEKDKVFETFGPETEESAPYLYIDVNINNEELHTISVFDGDRPEELAKNFAQEQMLDNETERKLVQLIKLQMATILSKIEEEDHEITDNSS